jgi:hypothetical protein
LLSLDRLEFLHLISYGNSTIDGSSIDEEDKRFNSIISKYIGRSLYLLQTSRLCRRLILISSFVDDQDILDSVQYFRGGPDSQAVVGDKVVYKHDLAELKPQSASRNKNNSRGSAGGVILTQATHNVKHKGYARNVVHSIFLLDAVE